MTYLITKQMFEINERMDSDLGTVAAKFVTKLKNYVFDPETNRSINLHSTCTQIFKRFSAKFEILIDIGK